MKYGISSGNNILPTANHRDSVIHELRTTQRTSILFSYSHYTGCNRRMEDPLPSYKRCLLIFLLIYLHMCRGIYFNSPRKLPTVWASGVVILMTRMGTAFIGYVLPWGQMSFWGATVITRILTAIPYVGNDITQWLWGNFSVSQPTLNRFFLYTFSYLWHWLR